MILAGGPKHGTRLPAMRPGDPDIYVTVVDSFRSLTGILTIPPARPRWWKDPVGWWRWKPAASTPVPGTTAEQHLYRRNGRLADGTPVYWYAGRDSEPPADLDGLIAVLAAEQRRALTEYVDGGWWEMGGDWYTAIRRMLHASPGEPMLGDCLLGREVRVTLGAPRIVTKETP